MSAISCLRISSLGMTDKAVLSVLCCPCSSSMDTKMSSSSPLGGGDEAAFVSEHSRSLSRLSTPDWNRHTAYVRKSQLVFASTHYSARIFGPVKKAVTIMVATFLVRSQKTRMKQLGRKLSRWGANKKTFAITSPHLQPIYWVKSLKKLATGKHKKW